ADDSANQPQVNPSAVKILRGPTMTSKPLKPSTVEKSLDIDAKVGSGTITDNSINQSQAKPSKNPKITGQLELIVEENFENDANIGDDQQTMDGNGKEQRKNAKKKQESINGSFRSYLEEQPAQIDAQPR